MHPTSVLATVLVVLSGCAAMPDDGHPTNTAIPTSPTPWHLVHQASLRSFVGAQVASASIEPPTDGYCNWLKFPVPEGTAWLNVTMVSEPVDLGQQRVGLLGVTARSESRNQWVDYPDVYNPKQSFLDNPKIISIADPEPGSWDVNIITQGVVYHAVGNVTLELEGVSDHAPAPLEIRFFHNGRTPCDPASSSAPVAAAPTPAT